MPEDLSENTLKWLDTRFQSVEAKVESAMGRLIDITEPMKKDIAHLRQDIHILFDRIGSAEKDIAIIKEDKQDRKSSVTTVLTIIGLIFMLGVAIIGWLLK